MTIGLAINRDTQAPGSAIDLHITDKRKTPIHQRRQARVRDRQIGRQPPVPEGSIQQQSE